MEIPLSDDQPKLASNPPETAAQNNWQMELLKLILQNWTGLLLRCNAIQPRKIYIIVSYLQ